MRIALVIGSTISTIKDEAIRGRKLLIVRKADTAGNMTGEPFVAVDTVSAGFREKVIAVSGSSARMAEGCKDVPVDSAIIGIVDDVSLD
jgi:microcompartment protein CcmK/EutM